LKFSSENQLTIHNQLNIFQVFFVIFLSSQDLEKVTSWSL